MRNFAWLESEFIQRRCDLAKTIRFIYKKIICFSQCSSFFGDLLQGKTLLAVLIRYLNLFIAIGSSASDIVATFDGCKPSSCLDFFVIFQIIRSTLQLHLEEFTVIFVLQVICFCRCHDLSVCVTESIDDTAAVLQITTAKTLRLDHYDCGDLFEFNKL